LQVLWVRLGEFRPDRLPVLRVAGPASEDLSDAASLSSEKASLVSSYHGAGISKLTEQIYVALAEAQMARKQVQGAIRLYGNDPERIEQSVSTLNHKTSFASGLVKAWEIVTGEIWGEAAWQPTTRRN
jgi:hypothetical protein